MTSSLATILWSQAIRRGEENFGFRHFLRMGAVAVAALIAALAARIVVG